MSDVPSKFELEISDLNDDKASKIENLIKNLPDIKTYKIDSGKNKLVVETTMPIFSLQDQIEKETSSLAVIKGSGDLDAAVAEVFSHWNRPFDIKGVIRFVQIDNNKCVIDGTVDGLVEGDHALNICEYGDFSDGFNKVGNHFNPFKKNHGRPEDVDRHLGDLGNITADKSGRSTFRKVDNLLNISDVIGRSICISERPDLLTNDTGEKLACGIIARSSRIYDNVKKICACSGKTLWDERRDAKL